MFHEPMVRTWRLFRKGHTQTFLRSGAKESRKDDMDTILVEIRAAEGGDDAKLLVLEQLRVYSKFMALERL